MPMPRVFEHAPRYHGGGFAGSGLLPDEVPIIARRGELVVPPERVVREEKTAREQRPITVVVNVTAADAELVPCQPGPDRGRHGARDRPGEPEPVRGTQFRGAIDTLRCCLAIAAATAAKLALEVEQPGVGRPAVLQQSGADMGPLPAGRTGRGDHMPSAQVTEPDRVARRKCSCFVPLQQRLCQSALASRAVGAPCGPAVTGGDHEWLSRGRVPGRHRQVGTTAFCGCNGA